MIFAYFGNKNIPSIVNRIKILFKKKQRISDTRLRSKTQSLGVWIMWAPLRTHTTMILKRSISLFSVTNFCLFSHRNPFKKSIEIFVWNSRKQYWLCISNFKSIPSMCVLCLYIHRTAYRLITRDYRPFANIILHQTFIRDPSISYMVWVYVSCVDQFSFSRLNGNNCWNDIIRSTECGVWCLWQAVNKCLSRLHWQ